MKLLLTFIRKCSAPFLLICTFFFVATQAGLAQAIARAGLLDAMQIRPGVAVEIPIDIEDVVDLYGIEIELEFDPTFWEFEDADPRREGIQPAIGTFLDPGMTLFSIIDMQEGRIHLVMSQVNPSQPKSGDGTIMVLYATAKKTGVTSFEVKKVELATRDGLDIAVEGVDGQITIESQAPVLTATAIPVIDPTEIIIVPTFSPPTATPVRTATPKPTQTKATTVTNAPTRTATLAPTVTQGFAATQAEQPTSAVVVEVGQVTPTGVQPAAPTETEESSGEGRILGKDTQGARPWVIGGGALLVIIAGVIVFTRRKHINQPDQTSQEDK
jgi:hypothetical protein